MYANSHWHADGLRWIGSLLFLVADRLERASATDAARRLSPADLLPDERIDEVRARIHSRYY